ncbi:MAG: response regulator [bacterium]|nr:response regulator [bacterium]
MSSIQRALFVDDEVHILEIYRKIAAMLPVDPLFASSAEEGWQLIQDKDIAVVVSDYRMPGANGAELLAWIRQKYPAAIRIICSGYTDTEVLIGSINSGHVFRFIHKPFKTEEIIDAVNDALLLFAQRLAQETEIQNLIEQTNTLHLIDFYKPLQESGFGEFSDEFSLYECLPIGVLLFDNVQCLRYANQVAKDICFAENNDDIFEIDTIHLPILVSIVSQSELASYSSEIIPLNGKKLLISVNSTYDCDAMCVTVSQLPD